MQKKKTLTLLMASLVLNLAVSLPPLHVLAQEEDEDSDSQESREGGPPFKNVVKKFQEMGGLFSFYRKQDDGRVLMEIRPEQFDKLYLCALTIEAGDGFMFHAPGMMNSFPFVFKRVGRKVMMIHKNVYFRADKSSATYKALQHGVSDSVVAVATIEAAPHPERGSVLVDPSTLFLRDVGDVGALTMELAQEDMGGPYFLDERNSYFGNIKTFPSNSEVEVVLNFASRGTPLPLTTVPDPQTFQHTYHFSLSELNEKSSYKPRAADDRVGHFTTIYQDYTSLLKETPYQRNIDRWDLQKSEPRFALSPPKKPIVFWLENTIPVEYRPAIREGILVWNKAFAKLGFKDAIVVKQQPDDATWDPADVRYNTVRWMVAPGSAYAFGPSRTNPFTGEIYDADISFSADMVRAAFTEHQEYIDPLTAQLQLPAKVQAIMGRWHRHASPLHQQQCTYPQEVAHQSAWGWNLLQTRAATGGSKVDMEKYIHDYLLSVTAHEVGHTLGLRHNYKASTVLNQAQLQDTKLTQEKGLTGSVMDYTPVNIAPQGQKQGQFWQTSLGAYDYWAIEYAYRTHEAESKETESQMLEAIAARSSRPELAYGTDEDAGWGIRGMDPSCNRFDLGQDPVVYYNHRLKLSKELLGQIEKQFEVKEQRYVKLRNVFNQALWEYFTTAINVTKYIGGIYAYRDHVGGRIPFEQVSAVKQREAFNLLKQQLFAPGAFQFSPSLLNKLAPERMDDFEGSAWMMSRTDYPIHSTILQLQSMPLRHLLSGSLLTRLQDNEVKAKKGEIPFTMVNLFEELRQAIWGELDNPAATINSFRRALQRQHLNLLVDLLLRRSYDVPEDARTLARADLMALKAKLEKAKGSDTYSKAHLDESLARADAALKAGISRSLGLR